MKINYEKFNDSLECLAKAFRELAESAVEVWERLKDLLKDLVPDQNDSYAKPQWSVPSKIILKNQVINRKPRMAVARSSC